MKKFIARKLIQLVKFLVGRFEVDDEEILEKLEKIQEREQNNDY